MWNTLPQIIEDLLIMGKSVRRQLEKLSKDKSTEPSDIHSAIIKALAGPITDPVCRLLQAGIN